MELKFNTEHVCLPDIKGDVITWKCPSCEYVRTFNIITGQMECDYEGEVTHSGSWVGGNLIYINEEQSMN